MNVFLMTVLLLLLNGCTHHFALTHFETGEVLNGQYNIATRTIKVTMPDGEILVGQFSAVENASYSFTNSTAFSGTKSATGFGCGVTTGGQGIAYSLLKSTTSKLMMESVVQYSTSTGQGFGEARTNDGRTFKVQF